ncbi:hypothetical protein ACI2UC_20320 [Ralstonia nicotianae]
MEPDDLDRLRLSFRAMLDKRALPEEKLKGLATSLFLACYATMAKCEEALANREISDAELACHAQELSRSLEAGNALGFIDFLAALPERFKQARQAGVVAVKSDGGKKAAEAKKAKLEPVKEFALELANEGNYPSRRNAAINIKERVSEFHRQIVGRCLMPDQAAKTIDGWLKDLGYAPKSKA